MCSRKRIKRGLSLDWFRVNQIRMARKRFTEGDGESIAWLMLQRIWCNREREYLTKERTKQTDQMVRDILRHVNPLWRDQR